MERVLSESEFHTILMTPSHLVNKAQQAILHGLRSSESFKDKKILLWTKFFLPLTFFRIIDSNYNSSSISSIESIATARSFSNMPRTGLCRLLLPLMISMQPFVRFKLFRRARKFSNTNHRWIRMLILWSIFSKACVTTFGLDQNFTSVLDDLIRVCQPGVYLT